MVDGNTYAINKHLDEQEQIEKVWEQFKKIYDVEELERALDYARTGAKDFGGHDFTDELSEELGLS